MEVVTWRYTQVYVPSEVGGRIGLPRLLSIDNVRGPTDVRPSFCHEKSRAILLLDGIDVGEACNTMHVTFRLRCHTQIHNSQHKSNNRSISTMFQQVLVLSKVCGAIHHIRL